MNLTATPISFQQTGYFSKIITDYLDGAAALQPFFQHHVSLEGIKAAVHAREQFETKRDVLVATLRKQYQAVNLSGRVKNNMERLLQAKTFTITTAHQPAIFTGTLYFIYKILHVIRLAAQLEKDLPGYGFVPVFYMGSEDADLEELGKIYLDQEKLTWDTKQTGAVGRMNTKGLDQIIDRIEGEYAVEPFGKELVAMLKAAYLDSPDIQTATFKLVNRLFAEYGLIVLIADDAGLKRQMSDIFEEDLFQQKPSAIVAETTEKLAGYYKVQANPREINLFYLKDDLRGRIEKVKDTFYVHDSPIRFTEDEIRKELSDHPDRFSPNVILRGLFQETILPNIAFIGGGGEMAYWFELKALFVHYKTPFPVLVLRNSFLIIEKKWKAKMTGAGLAVPQLFIAEEKLLNDWVKSKSGNQLSLEKEITEYTAYYERLKKIAGQVDVTLARHTEALLAKALKPIKELEKKLLRAEKRKFEDRRRQIHELKTALFPLHGLQERIDNFMPFYAKWGPAFIENLYRHSLTLEQQFMILVEH